MENERAFYFLAGILFCLVLWKLILLLRDKKREKFLGQELPLEWRNIVHENVPIVRKLPDKLKSELEGLIYLFLEEKEFIGCEGLEITDEIRLTIAAQACLLLLNRKTKYYPSLYTILVYPDAFYTHNVDYAGPVKSVSVNVTYGQSHERGPVVLAWSQVYTGAYNPADGKNVVFHEFAHQLDQETGRHNGVPVLEDYSKYAPWVKIVGDEFTEFRDKIYDNQKTFFDSYGVSEPAEFFAVATEAFFEKPLQFKKKKPDLYEQLASLYKLDPAAW